ncbi:MAG: ATP-dependent Clp protease ATP-binding subunit ClpX, partial [Actinomycetota bacterium]|nr:ATP-dependent Clp protease ATP-binding subunit ClpX [Actinomycetota bacterium]
RKERNVGEILAHIMPQDLLKFGMIPEFVGRVPIIVTLDALTEDDLVRILLEPKNALVKQYKKFFEFDGVELRFTEGALRAVARKAMQRNTGARGLRAILEECLLDVMYELPSRNDIIRCVVTKDTIERGTEPTLVTSAGDYKDEESA